MTDSLQRRLRRRHGVFLCEGRFGLGDLVVVDDGPRGRLRRVGDLAALGIAASTIELETLWVLPQRLYVQLQPLLPPGATTLRRRRRGGQAGADRVDVVVPLLCHDVGVLEQALLHHVQEGRPWRREWLVVTSLVPPRAPAAVSLFGAHRLRRAALARPRTALLPYGRDWPALPVARQVSSEIRAPGDRGPRHRRR